MIATVLEIAKKGEALDRQSLMNVFLSNRHVRATLRYAVRCGLLDKRYHLTQFGRFVAHLDPTLSKLDTQWLLHYHLAAPHHQTAFWNRLVIRWFLMCNTLTTEDLTSDLAEFLRAETGKEPTPRSVRSAVSIFVNTYLRPDGLNRLELLKEIRRGVYRVLDPSPPSPWALGYALAEYWQAHYGERLGINLDDVSGERFASLFMLGERRFIELLFELKHANIIDLHRTAHPYQLVMLDPRLETALERLRVHQYYYSEIQATIDR